MGADELAKADDFLNEILSVSTTLSEEAMSAARSRCLEMKFDPDRGIVPLQESFINLSSARSTLEEAIEKQKLIQLPITVQKELLTNLETISRTIQGMTAGKDEVVNFTNAVEALNSSIWKYGLHNLSDQVLGYQKKLNQIKNLEVRLSRAAAELQNAQDAAEKAILAASEIEQNKTTSSSIIEQLRQTSTASLALLEQIKDAESKALVLHATIQQQEKQTGELASNIKTANNELLSLDTSIRKFYGEVDEYRKKIDETNELASNFLRSSEAGYKTLTEDTVAKLEERTESLRQTEKSLNDELMKTFGETSTELTEKIDAVTEEAQSSLKVLQKDLQTKTEIVLDEVRATSETIVEGVRTETSALHKTFDTKCGELEAALNQRSTDTIEKNQKETTALIAELATLKDQVREQIQQATGFTLFGAFQARQNEISKSKNFWVWAIAVLVVVSAIVTIWIAHEAQYYQANDFAFWVKLSLTIPLGFAITFCTVQYGRERRLEEEYAFKSSISVSLNPYRELIRSMLDKDGAGDTKKYTDFVIDSVTNVFTPPTDKVFDVEKKPGLTAKTFKQTAEIIGTAVKAAK